MNFLTVFLNYFARRLKRVWWQALLIIFVFWLPLDILSTWVDSVFHEHQESMPYLLVKTSGDIVLDLLIWSFGLTLLLLVVRESEVIEREFRQSQLTSEHPQDEPGNFSWEAWDLWRPRWASLVREAVPIWPRLMVTRILQGAALVCGFIMLCIPGIYIMVKLAVTDILVVREGVWGFSAMNRSSQLTEGRFWKVFLLLVLSTVLITAVAVPFIVIMAAMAYFYPVFEEPQFWFVQAVMLAPLNVVLVYFYIFVYCLYNFLQWDQAFGDSHPVEEFLDYHPEVGPQPLAMEPATAILIRKIPLSETSVIAVWLTREHGLLRTAARGARKAKSPFAGKLDLFYLAEIAVIQAKRGDLHTLREVQLIDALPTLRLDYQKIQLAAYFVELLEMTIESDHPEPELYDLLLRALRYLEENPAGRRAMAHFERELARLLGHGEAGNLEQSLNQGSARPALAALHQAYHRLPKGHAELWRGLE